jgi:hypothetical protein
MIAPLLHKILEKKLLMSYCLAEKKKEVSSILTAKNCAITQFPRGSGRPPTINHDGFTAIDHNHSQGTASASARVGRGAILYLCGEY